jgi:Uma2 family endonuclease
MTTAVSVERKVWTEAELQALPEDGYIHEVVDGELVMSPKNNPYHGDICADLSMALRAFAKGRQLGAVFDSNTGFWMHNRNCRAPDVSFVSRERLQALGITRHTREFFPGAPDLAVEVLSPNNTRKETDERLKDFFASGTQIAWIINPDTECVEVCHAPDQRKLLGSGADLDGEHLLPGFRYPIADLFKGWDWE